MQQCWRNEEKYIIEDEEGDTFVFSYTENSIYYYHSELTVSCWVRYSYLNNEQIQISAI